MLRDQLGPRGPMKAILVDERPDAKCASRRFATARTVTSQRYPRFRVERITNRPTQTAPRKPALLVHGSYNCSVVSARAPEGRSRTLARSAGTSLPERFLVGAPRARYNERREAGVCRREIGRHWVATAEALLAEGERLSGGRATQAFRTGRMSIRRSASSPFDEASPHHPWRGEIRVAPSDRPIGLWLRAARGNRIGGHQGVHCRKTSTH